MFTILKFTLVIGSLSFLIACGQFTTVKTSEATDNSDSSASSAQVSKSLEEGNQAQTRTRFAPDTLYALLVAEVAADRRQYDITLENYVRQAEKTEDINVIARAARIAQFFRNYPKAIDMGELWIAKDAASIEAYALVTSAHIALKQIEQALDNAETLLTLIDPNADTANRQAAITETIASNAQDQEPAVLDRLIARYAQLSAQYPDYPSIVVGLSKLHEAKGDLDTAYSVISDSIAEDTDYEPAIIQQVRLLQLNNRTEDALAILKSELANKPDNRRLQLVYARLLTRTDPNAAYEELTQLSKTSAQPDIIFLRALVAIEIEKFEVSKNLLENLLANNYQTNKVLFYLGTVESTLGNTERALELYLSVEPSDDYIPAQALAATLVADQYGIDAISPHFKTQRETAGAYRPSLYIEEANLYSRSGDSDQALNVLTQALAEYPDNIALLYNRSTLYEQQNQLGLMENDLREILTLDPNNAAALNALGYVLTSKMSRHQEALPLLEKALSIRPDDAAIIDSMGWVLFNLGRYDESLVLLRKAFELFPDPEVAAHLGEVLWITGQQEEAKTIWNNTLDENPDDNYIVDTMQRLNVSP